MRMYNIKDKGLKEKIRLMSEELSRAPKSHIELLGVVGGDESRHLLWAPFGKVDSAIQEIVEKFKARHEGKEYAEADDIEFFCGDLRRALSACSALYPVIDKRITDEERQKKLEDFEKKRIEREAKAEKAWEELQPVAAWLVPEVTGMIVGIYVESDCEMQSDYYGTKDKRKVILDLTTNTRNDFKELRLAAANCPDTSHLAEFKSDWEHRENYSMGHGYYLKDTGKYDTGWEISVIWINWKDKLGNRKTPKEVLEDFIYSGSVGIPYENFLPKNQPKTFEETEKLNGKDGVIISENKQLNGIEIKFKAKPSPEVLHLLKSHGYRWSIRNKVWYCRYEQSRMDWALSTFGVVKEEVEAAR